MQAYVNIANSFRGQNGIACGGRAVTSLNEAINYVEWVSGQKDTVGVYVCMSTQRQPGEAKINGAGRTYYKSHREQRNAVALKSIWLDIDTKLTHAEAEYDDLPAAAMAFTKFRKEVRLPPPSIVVCTGGGLQPHWTTAHSLTPDEWKPLAHALAEAAERAGLHCDTACSINSAQIMRVPGTENRKVNPPLAARIIGTPAEGDYSVEFLSNILEPYKVALPAGQPTTSFLLDPSLWTPRAAVENDLGKGFETERPPIKLDDVAAECAFISDALTSGGKDYTNPLRNLTTLISTFTEGGRADAHRMGDKHPGYTQNSTEDLFDRKEREKAQKGLGWPLCKTIGASGCTACKACPHFGAGKSPLHFTRRSLPSQVTASASSATFPDPWAEFVGPPFPLEILAPPLASFVDAEHRAMGADASALAMASLTAVAGAIHAETRVRMGSGWSERPLLWTALVGSPSSMKSPVIEKTIAPLRKIDHDGHARWLQLYGQWKQRKSAGSKPGPGPCPPKPARQIIQDGTPEKIAELLARSDSGSLMVHDELAGHIASFDRYGSGPASRSFFLSCWNGGPFVKDRVGQGARDENAEIRVENLALGVLGGIQPDRLAQIKDLTSDGLLQRYFLVAMRSPVRGDESHPVNTAESDYAKLIQSLHLAQPREYAFGPKAAVVRGRVLDRLFRLEQLEGFPDALIGAIGKMRGYYGRLALVLHLANECAANPNGTAFAFSTDIAEDTAEGAEKLLFNFLLPHVFGVYDVIASGGKHREIIRAIAGFILAEDKNRIRLSDFTAGVRKLRNDSHKEIADCASRFCALGWLRPEDDNAPMPKAWLVASGLREHFAERRKQVQQARAEAHAILSAGGKRA